MAAYKAGHTVVGIDTDDRRAGQIQSGVSPVSDVDSSELSFALESGRYSVESHYENLTGFASAIITVPTPLKDGKPNLRFIEAAAASLARHISPGSLIVLESTTYPGTTEELLVPILESGSNLVAGKDFHVGYSPERIDPGNREWNLINTPKITSGINEDSAAAVAELYSGFGITVVPVSGTREAELTKLLENTFRHVNIALVNELAMFSSQLGVNIWEAIDAASTKPFGFMKFLPGPGVGGHCLPVDPSYLSWAIKEKAGASFRFVELANTVNSFMPNFVVGKVENFLVEQGSALKDSKILLGGLSYKPQTGDIRESPALVIAELLTSQGASVYAIDDYVSNYDWPAFVLHHNPHSGSYDAGIVITPHDEEIAATLVKACKVVLDTRNVVAGPNVRSL
jgi:nucleotide sugar dehydrogenase